MTTSLLESELAPQSAAPKRRRLLMVAYFYPPLGGAGIQRTLTFSRYLPDYGWQPVVITPRNPGYEIRDEGALAKLPPGIEIERSFIFEPWWPIYRRLQRLGRLRRPGSTDPAVDGAPTSANAPRPGQSRASRVASLVFFPDEHLTWIPFAVRSALAAHRRRPAQAIYSTSPAITGHIVAGLVARRTGLAWVADFRDPWVGNSLLPPLPGPYRRLQRWLERWIIDNAAHVVSVTPSLTDALRARYPASSEKITTITNGYDAEEIRTVVPAARDDRFFRLVYGGSLTAGKEGLDTFLSGVALFLDRDANAIDRLRVEFIGWMDEASSATARQWLADPRLSTVVTFSGHRSRSEAMAAAAGADAALYLLANDPGSKMFVGGKLFDYIGLGLPVLAVVPDGDAKNMLNSLGWSVVADPTPEGVAGGLRRLLSARLSRDGADPEGRFDRRNLARTLAEQLDAAVD